MIPTPAKEDFSVAIICALLVESQAVEAVFDEVYETNQVLWQKANGDRNAYTTGRIGRHHTVLVCMPGIGKVNAATTASHLNSTFINIELALVVGICGGAPYTSQSRSTSFAENAELFLGDVVVSTRILQTDFGRELVDGFAIKGMEEGNLPPSDPEIASLLHKLQNPSVLRKLQTTTTSWTRILVDRLAVPIPGKKSDILYQANYFHKHHSTIDDDCNICNDSESAMCSFSKHASCRDLECERSFRQRCRDREPADGPRIIFGAVSSSDSVGKNGTLRDQISAKYAIVAFEMEAAGVCKTLPTVVVKGVCDYADSHKNKIWQPYAAITAAACAKAILAEWLSSARPSNYRTQKMDAEVLKQSPARYVASLWFMELDLRLHNIKFPLPNTCAWISNAEPFQTWLDNNQAFRHNRVLWIKGKPGCGKSTMLKYLYHSHTQYLPDHEVVVYFFHARGSELQKTPMGMLRSILYQLLSKKPELINRFVRAHPHRFRNETDQHQWSYEELEAFLMLCAQQGWVKNILLLIDALDECDGGEAAKLSTFCEDLAVNAIASKTSWFICLSIRHFPSVSMKKCALMNLDQRKEHKSDIQSYIDAKLRVPQAELEAEILRRSNHVFLWVVLVVESLNSAYDTGCNGQSLHKLLEELPDQLHAMIERLLNSQGPGKGDLGLILQLILYSLEPIIAVELHFLVLTANEVLPLDAEELQSMSSDALRRFFVSISRGLLETVSQPSIMRGRDTIQFIHETVRDYLWNDANSLQTIVSPAGISHKAIAQLCLAGLRHLNLNMQMYHHIRNDVANRGSPSPEYDLVAEALHDSPHGYLMPPPPGDSRCEGSYMSRWVLIHICRAEDSSETIEYLRTYSEVFEICCQLQGWDHLSKGAEDGLLRSIIKIVGVSHLSFRGQLAKLLSMVLGDKISMSRNAKYATRGLYQFALQDAIDLLWVEGVDVLLKAGACLTTSTVDGNMLQYALVRTNCATSALTLNDRRDAVTKLLLVAFQASGYSIEYSPDYVCAPLVLACELHSIPIIEALLEAGANVEAVDAGQDSPLRTALLCQRFDVSKLLLEHGADPTRKNGYGNSPLSLARSRRDKKWQVLFEEWVACQPEERTRRERKARTTMRKEKRNGPLT